MLMALTIWSNITATMKQKHPPPNYSPHVISYVFSLSPEKYNNTFCSLSVFLPALTDLWNVSLFIASGCHLNKCLLHYCQNDLWPKTHFSSWWWYQGKQLLSGANTLIALKKVSRFSQWEIGNVTHSLPKISVHTVMREVAADGH